MSNGLRAQESSKVSCYHPSLWDFGVANDVLLPEIPGWFRFVWIANRGLLWRPEYKETHKIIQSSHPLRQILSASASSHDHHSPVAQVSCWRASNWNLENNEMSFQETTGCTMRWTTTPHPSPGGKMAIDGQSMQILFAWTISYFKSGIPGIPWRKTLKQTLPNADRSKQLRWYQVTKRSVMWLRYNLAQLWEIDIMIFYQR